MAFASAERIFEEIDDPDSPSCGAVLQSSTHVAVKGGFVWEWMAFSASALCSLMGINNYWAVECAKTVFIVAGTKIAYKFIRCGEPSTALPEGIYGVAPLNIMARQERLKRELKSNSNAAVAAGVSFQWVGNATIAIFGTLYGPVSFPVYCLGVLAIDGASAWVFSDRGVGLRAGTSGVAYNLADLAGEKILENHLPLAAPIVREGVKTLLITPATGVGYAAPDLWTKLAKCRSKFWNSCSTALLNCGSTLFPAAKDQSNQRQQSIPLTEIKVKTNGAAHAANVLPASAALVMVSEIGMQRTFTFIQSDDFDDGPPDDDDALDLEADRKEPEKDAAISEVERDTLPQSPLNVSPRVVEVLEEQAAPRERSEYLGRPFCEFFGERQGSEAKFPKDKVLRVRAPSAAAEVAEEKDLPKLTREEQEIFAEDNSDVFVRDQPQSAERSWSFWPFR